MVGAIQIERETEEPPAEATPEIAHTQTKPHPEAEICGRDR